MRVLAATTLVSALAVATLACDRNECSDPVFANPTTATWTTPAGGPSGGVVVVRWSRPSDERLPDYYYASAWATGPAAGGDASVEPLESAQLTGPRELTIAVRDLDAFIASGSHVRFGISVPAMKVKCNAHLGTGDWYAVTLTFAFDKTNHTVSAKFDPVEARRQERCGFAPSPARAPASSLMVPLLAVDLFVRRRVHRRSGSGVA